MPRTGRPKISFELTAPQLAEAREALQVRKLPADQAMRLKILLMSAEGLASPAVAERLETTPATVFKWRKRYQEGGIEALVDLPRAGRPSTLKEEQVAALLRKTLQSRPEGKSHWSARSFALEHDLSKSTVARLWRDCGLKPHRSRSFKLSDDPLFVQKVVDITGLYLNPPQNALVLCVDEKSQIQALERTQPALPMGLGYAEGYTHDYKRHGTATLFAALKVATGEVLTSCKNGHRHDHFLDFLRQIDSNTPAELDLHLVLDNYATHKHPKVRLWLSRHPRFQLHFTPTYSSWLNQVEIFFGIITRQAIRRSSHRSVKDLVATINRYVENYNKNATPFSWSATSESILLKLERLLLRISGTRH